jgi:hypothetical protein
MAAGGRSLEYWNCRDLRELLEWLPPRPFASIAFM